MRSYGPYSHAPRVSTGASFSSPANARTVRGRNSVPISRFSPGAISTGRTASLPSPAIRQEITDYLQDHAHEIRNECLITADYTKTSEQDYAVHCKVREGSSSLIDLTLTVPTESAARALADNWKQRSQEAYETLMKLLTS